MPTPNTVAADRVPTLAEALGIAAFDPPAGAEAFAESQGCEVVAFTGSGGKTTAMFRLAAELVAHGARVLITTTTHIYPPDAQQFPTTVIEGSLEDLVRGARSVLVQSSAVVLARELGTDGKLVGLGPEWIEQLPKRLQVTHLLVEADGSRGRPFKAPAEHEPVIPPSADLVVAVVGLSAVGQALSEEFVHRPERVAALAGCRLGDRISPSLVATVLLHPRGSTRGVPARARVVALLNQADDEIRFEAGCEVARELIERGAERVVIAALREAMPIRRVITGRSNAQEILSHVVPEARPAREVITGRSGEGASDPARVSAVVLAAGEGRRMRSKAPHRAESGLAGDSASKLALLLDGKSLLRRVVEAALASPVDEVVVVLGHGASELEQELPRDPRVRTIFNPDYATGQSSSLRAGINAIASQAQAVVFLLGDQPLVSPQAIEAIVSAFRSHPSAVVQPLYRGTPGNPVLFSQALFPELLQVTGDQGGREVLARHQAEVATVELNLEPLIDIDTAEDYSQLLRKLSDLEQL
jgi:molybdenum cofactor cytidylyltransferase